MEISDLFVSSEIGIGVWLIANRRIERLGFLVERFRKSLIEAENAHDRVSATL